MTSACNICKKSPATEGRKTCAPCRDKRNEYMRKYAAERPDLQAANRRRLDAWGANPENKKRWKKKRYEQRTALRQEAMQAYGGGRCKCCGCAEPEWLTLRHVNNDGKEHRLEVCGPNQETGWAFYRKLKKLGWPKDRHIEVWCYNCHFAKEKFGRCPHEHDREYEGYLNT